MTHASASASSAPGQSGESGESGVSAAMLRAALEWQVTLWSGEASTAELHALEQWRSTHPDHERAWQQVRRIDQSLHARADPLSARVLRAARPNNPRRTVLRGLVFAAGAGALTIAMRDTPQWQAVSADYATGRGERRDVRLPDGSVITLNTASAIDVRFSSRERRVLLRAGEILVTTASDPAAIVRSGHRPFIVETGEGDVRAIGTRFTVRALDGRQQVQVFEGAVEIAPRSLVQAPMRLDAGQQTRFDRLTVDPARSADPLSAAWAKGLLVAERMRLDDFLAELARYRSGVLRCNAQVAGLAVSGVYPLSDTDRILESLEHALPVRVNAITRYWVTVGAR